MESQTKDVTVNPSPVGGPEGLTANQQKREKEAYRFATLCANVYVAESLLFSLLSQEICWLRRV